MMTPRLALDRLEQDRDGVVVDARPRAPRRRRTARSTKPGRERAEAVARGRVVGEADDGGGAAVEVAAARRRSSRGRRATPLTLVAPLAGHLERGLDGLGARVHGQDHVHAAERGELLGERAEQVVVERAAGQREAVELRLGGGDEARVAVAEVQRAVAGEHVEVAATVDVRRPTRPRRWRATTGSGW